MFLNVLKYDGLGNKSKMDKQDSIGPLFSIIWGSKLNCQGLSVYM